LCIVLHYAVLYCFVLFWSDYLFFVFSEPLILIEKEEEEEENHAFCVF
jgi:hypothetical protein